MMTNFVPIHSVYSGPHKMFKASNFTGYNSAYLVIGLFKIFPEV